MSDVPYIPSVATHRRCKGEIIYKMEAGCIREYFDSRRLNQNSMTENFLKQLHPRYLQRNKKDKAVTN